MDLSLARFIAGLAAAPTPMDSEGWRRAAVAAVLRFDGGVPEVLLMERATRADDHWSGHISFPGGREEKGDADLLATAIRETREEVGVDLSRARLLGALDPVRVVADGKLLPMTINPFVFHLAEPQDLILSDEAKAAFWFPLADGARGALDGYYPYRNETMSLSLPCWQWEGRVIWGLTYQMLRALLARVG